MSEARVHDVIIYGGELPLGNPLVGKLCVACRKPFVRGQRFIGYILGPGDDRCQRTLAREGKSYIRRVTYTHYLCSQVAYWPDHEPQKSGV